MDPLNPEFLEGDISQEDAWDVIRAYFKQHGLVSQQISSFNRFLKYNVQDVVSEQDYVRVRLESQYTSSKHRPFLIISI